MTEIVIRPARRDDLPHVYDIWAEAEGGGLPRAPADGPLVALFAHELATGTMNVAEERGKILGFAAVIRRSGIAFVSEFYVRERVRSSSIGKRLLEATLAGDRSVRCTLSSGDPRALSLYLKLGMAPRWPNFVLLAEVDRLTALPPSDAEVRPANLADGLFQEWDAEISGRSRPEDHAYWLRENRAEPAWFLRDGGLVGYGFLQMRSDDFHHNAGALSIGPLGARTRDDAVACVLAAVRWAAARGVILRIGVPGPHPALRPLLEAGFRILYTETFMDSAFDSFVDVQRYVPSGSTLF